MKLVHIVTLGLFAVSSAVAQTREDHPHFEVASIRPVASFVAPSFTSPRTGDPGRIAWARISVRMLIGNAYPEYIMYGLDGRRISGPSWVEDEYSVAAKIPPGSTSAEVTQMLQNR
jgi:uncharacterized protein (TIGR03435 family)